MPQAILRRERVVELLGRPVSDATLEDLLFTSKAELEAHDADTLTVSVTPDRLDLLSEGGLGLHLQGAIGVARGLGYDPAALAPLPGVTVEADASVGRLRPTIAALAVVAPDDRGLDDGTLEEAVRFQELLHASVGRDRRAASLGIYPLDRLVPPFRYAEELLSDVRFVPLDGSVEVAGDEFFGSHPLALRFGALGRRGDRCLTFRDRAGTILSLPPILNGRTGGEARVGDRRLLLESTGPAERAVRESLGLLAVVFAARGWTLHAVPIGGTGPLIGDGRVIVAPRQGDLPAPTLRALAGTSYPPSEVEHRFALARLSARPEEGSWSVRVPPWRPDVQAAVDLAEEVILAQAVRPEDGRLPPSPTRGRRLARVGFRRRIATALLGLGFAAPHTSLLVSTAAVARLPGGAPIPLAYPPSSESAYVRDRLLLSHLELLARNTRRAYPQLVGEVGPVIRRATDAETGGETRYHAGVVLATESAGFADAAALVDYLLRTVDVGSVREPAELPGTIPGRGARVRVAGEAVAELGEIDPVVLDGIGVRVPVAWAEVDLGGLAPLAGVADDTP